MSDAVLMGAGTGAASGAAMGTTLAPGWGTAIGAVAGGAMGALGGMGQDKQAKAQKKALKAQEAAIRAEQTRRAQGIAAARSTFGDISSYGQAFSGGTGPAAAQDPSRFQDIGKTLNNRSLIQGQIDTQASAVRDAGRMGLTDSAQQGSAGVRQASAARGLMGSSLDASHRQALLGQYASGRSDLAGAVDATRQGGWNAVQGQQRAFEGAAGGGNVNAQMGALGTAGLVAGARAQLPVVAMGNTLNMGLGLLRQGALAETNGGKGVTALGLPSLGLAPATGRKATV